MAKQIWKRNEPHYGGEKNKTREDGNDCFKRRLSRSRCRPACFRDGLIRSRFFAPAASLPPPFRSGVPELIAEGCPQEEKAGRRGHVRDPRVPRFRGSLPGSRKGLQRPRLGASKRPDKA